RGMSATFGSRTPPTSRLLDGGCPSWPPCSPRTPRARASSLPRKDVTERTFSRFDAGLHRILCLHPHMKKKQADRRWTVMLVPHGSGSSRAVEVSQTVVKALVGIGSVVALLFLVLGVTALSRGVRFTSSPAPARAHLLPARHVQP